MKNALITLYVSVMVMIVSPCWAQTGASDNRVSLPDGPGSVSGFSDNAEINLNMGSMSFNVPIDLPSGVGKETPSISLSYSSMAGNSLLGMGWSLSTSSIERSTAQGLPQYQTTDGFVVDESNKIVEVGPATGLNAFTYRAESEGSFIRYRWHDRGEGDEGYWTAESPNGVVEYYGADSTGSLVESARMGSDDRGTFRFHVVEQVDSLGNRAIYEYEDSVEGSRGSTKLIKNISYAFDGAGTPLYEVKFDYEDRPDPLSDCRPGYCEVMGKRLKQVSILRGGVTATTYKLTYETIDSQADLSRLTTIKIYGVNDVELEAHYTFGYSKALGMACEDASCGQPYLVDLGEIEGNVRVGQATLIDLNGDALPDLVNTTSGGHSVQYNELQVNGDVDVQSFGAPIVLTAVDNTDTSRYQLQLPFVQTMDVDGNGFSDIVNYSRATYLANFGNGRWEREVELNQGSQYPNPNFADTIGNDGGELDNVRFFDYDQNGRIDILRITSTNTEVFSTSRSGEITKVTDVQQIGEAFGLGFDSGLELADMNGDGLQDLVKLSEGRIQYRLYLGYGRWDSEVTITISDLPAVDLQFTDLEDVNGDGLTDLIMVKNDDLKYALNLNEKSFSSWYYFSNNLDFSLPLREESTLVLYADMNGNGSTDVVWINGTSVKFLEIFPVRPNLLNRIDNHIGKQTEVFYDSSVRESVRSTQRGSDFAWEYNIPHAMTIVTGKQIHIDANDINTQEAYTYRNAYYDGQRKQFRGYEITTLQLQNTEGRSQDPYQIVDQYDIGTSDREDAYRLAGLLLRSETLAESTLGRGVFDKPIVSVSSSYELCDVEGVPANLSRFACKLSTTTVEREGLSLSESATLKSEYDYDGYGRIIQTIHHGVTSMGSVGCGACDRANGQYGLACGDDCLGDELYEEMDYVSPKTEMFGWRLDLVAATRSYSSAGSSIVSEKTYHYDGAEFVGLREGEFGLHGLLHRVSESVNESKARDQARKRYNDQGLVIEELTGNATPNGPGSTQLRYDERGINLKEIEVLLEDEMGNPYSLIRYYDYDAIWQKVSRASRWLLGSESRDPEFDTTYEYDAFARVTRITASSVSGDETRALSKTYEYTMGPDHTRVKSIYASPEESRTVIFCYNGEQKLFQKKAMESNSRYIVSDYKVYNTDGAIIREYENHISPSGTCDLTPPSGVRARKYTYDPVGRVREIKAQDDDIYQSASVTRTEYLPRRKLEYDMLDTDSSSPHFNTPLITHFDGQNRIVRVEKLLDADRSDKAVYELYYDEFNSMSGYMDPDGHIRQQVRDQVGQLVLSRDPNTGDRRYEYDDNGNLTRVTDARGVSRVYEYDAINRLVATYEDGRRMETLITKYYDFPRSCPEDICTHTATKEVEATYPLDDLGQGSTWYGFDERGLNTFYSQTIGRARFDVNYDYNAFDAITRKVFPGGEELTYSYDSLGRVSSIGEFLTDVEFNDYGLTDNYTLGNGVVASFTYDSRMRQTELKFERGGSPLAHIKASYDRGSNITQVKDLVRSDEASQTKRLEIDSWYRLVRAELGEETSKEAITYEYSLSDNILSKVSELPSSRAHVGSYSYLPEHPNAVAQAGDLSYGYDEAGQMVQRGSQTMAWDFFGRLTSLKDEESSLDAQYYYGSSLSRVAKRENGQLTYYVMDDYEVRDGQGVISVKMGNLLVAKVYQSALVDETLRDMAPFDVNMMGVLSPEGDERLLASDAWAAQQVENDIWSLIEGEAQKTQRALHSSARRSLFALGGEVSYFHNDFSQSIFMVTDEQGEISEHNVYYPFGELKFGPYGLLETKLYTQKERDMSGLTYFGARYADTQLGRFISPDPTFTNLEGSEFNSPSEATNPYLFSNNRPTTQIDPDGKVAILVPAIAIMVTGAGALASEYFRKKRQAAWAEDQADDSFGALMDYGGNTLGAGGTLGVSIATNAYESMVAINSANEAKELGIAGDADFADEQGAKDVKFLAEYDRNAAKVQGVSKLVNAVASVGASYVGITLAIALGFASAPVTGPALAASAGVAAVMGLAQFGYSQYKRYKMKKQRPDLLAKRERLRKEAAKKKATKEKSAKAKKQKTRPRSNAVTQ